MGTAQDRACFQEGIEKLQEWAQKWQMAFNTDKCHILHMGEHNQNFKYQLGGEDLETVSFEKDVGVLVSVPEQPLKPTKCWVKFRGGELYRQEHFLEAVQDLRKATPGVLPSCLVPMDSRR